MIQSNLFRRVITGALGIAALMLLLVFGGRIGAYLFGVGLVMGCALEYGQMFFEKRRWIFAGYLAMISWVIFLYPDEAVLVLSFSFLIFVVLNLARAAEESETQLQKRMSQVALASVGLLYLGWVPCMVGAIRIAPNGLSLLFWFLILNWTSDSAAYFWGRKQGKTPLAPSLSPKKSVEGAVAGLIATCCVGVFLGIKILTDYSPVVLLIWSAMISIVAQLGDLFESFLKRVGHTKDSGGLLPGHGGLLDRFDGVIFSLPVMYSGLRIFL